MIMRVTCCMMCYLSCPFCVESEPVKCWNPGYPEFGHRDGSNFIVGSEVVFTCEEGYELIGSSHMQCTEIGEWDGTFPYCKGNQTDQMQWANGELSIAEKAGLTLDQGWAI